MDIETLRQLIFNNPRAQDGYPQAVREAAARYARSRRDQGATWSDIEAEVGISCTSMRNWMGVATPSGFQQVVVIDEPPENFTVGIVITSPTGFTLTGCTLDQAALVFRSLR